MRTRMHEDVMIKPTEQHANLKSFAEEVCAFTNLMFMFEFYVTFEFECF